MFSIFIGLSLYIIHSAYIIMAYFKVLFYIIIAPNKEDFPRLHAVKKA